MHNNSSLKIFKGVPPLLALVFTLLALPAAMGFIHNNAQETRALEKRRKASRPPLALLRSKPREFITASEAWMKDTAGFRHQANMLYRKLRYYVFRDPPMPNLTLGKEGHMFLNSPKPTAPNAFFELLCVQQAEPAQELLEKMDGTFAAVSRVFARRGAHVTFAIVPSDLSIYADKLPLSTPARYRQACRAYPHQDHLLAQLRRQGEQTGRYQVFYPRDLFFAHRDEYAFYPKESYHWAGRSVYLFTRHLLKESGVLDRLLLDDPAELTSSHLDLSGFLGFPRTVEAYSYAYAKQPIQTSPVSWLKGAADGHDMLFRTTVAGGLSDKSALLISNSFGTALAPHLARGFRELYALDTNLLPQKERLSAYRAVTERLRPDYVYLVFNDVLAAMLPEWLDGLVALDQTENQPAAKGSSLEKSGR